MKKTVLFLLACIIFPLLLHGQQLTLATLDWQPYVGSDMMIPVDLFPFKV
jgi:hypothetical protein